MSDELYTFIYEFGKQPKTTRTVFANKVAAFIQAYYISTDEELKTAYPALKLGEETRDAKTKADNLRPTKNLNPKTKKTKIKGEK